jgi:Asp-tRNA(Asn)/Glu-tRNA(Gln) amidotransferase A subunit family amidase
VAVTASFAAVGWGTDACGSIRVPASQNNLTGLRPSKGLSSIDGILTLSHSHDVAGPLARSVHDLAIALDATIGPDPADPATRTLAGRSLPRFVDALDPTALRGTRIGLLGSFFGSLPEDQPASTVVRRALQEMATLGAIIVPVELPGLENMAQQAIVMGDEFKWDLLDYLADVPGAPVRSLTELLALGLVDEELVPFLRLLDQPRSRTTPEYLEALAARERLRQATIDMMDRYDVDAVVYPTLLRIASYLNDPQLGSNCRLSTTTGLPALTVPAGFTERGLPIGLELLGRPFEDAQLVALGYAYEQAVDHRDPPPAAPPLVGGSAPPPVVFEVMAREPASANQGGDPAEVRVRFVVDRIMGRLGYDFEVHGAAPENVYAIVLRAADASGQWSVSRRLSGPGATFGSGVFTLDAALRSRLERGELHLDLFTREHPFGAARAVLRLPD